MKRKPKPIDILIVFLCLAALAAGIFFARDSAPKETNPYYTIEYELVRVTKVMYENYTLDESAENVPRGSQSLNVEILTGRFKGLTMPVTNYLGPLHEKIAKEGSVLTVTITADSREDGFQISIVNFDFTWLLIGMLALFIAAVVFVGRGKGVMSLLGLAYSLAAIVFFLVPMWLKGYPALLLTLVSCIFITVFSFTLLGGVTRKTVSAMLGTLLCVLVAGVFAIVCGKIAGVSGLTMDEAEWLLDESRTLDGVTLNVRGLFVSGILISALGAVMDVAMSISSAIAELRDVDPTLSRGRLFRSGMNIGRDMIGTMTNTLILAFVGTSLNLIIIMYAAGMQPYQFFNNDDTIMEIIRGVAGSIGLVLAVPLTAALAAAAAKKQASAAPTNPKKARNGK